MLTIDQLFQGLGVPCSPKRAIVDALAEAGIIRDEGSQKFSGAARSAVAEFVNLRKQGYAFDEAVAAVGRHAIKIEEPVAPSGQVVPRRDYSRIPKVEPPKVVLLGGGLPGKGEKADLEIAARPAEPPPVPADVKTQTEILHLKNLVLESKRETLELVRESRRQMQEWEEERRNARARIARLEDGASRRKSEGFFGRLKSAMNILLGYSAAIPALPAVSSASVSKQVTETEFLRRIAA